MKWFKADFKSAKKGATLSEMSVVIAIIAIVAVSVVTFTSLSSEVTKMSASKEMATERVEFIENLVEGWVDSAIVNNATDLKVQDNKLAAKIEGEDIGLYFSNGVLKAKFSAENETSLDCEEIKEIKFEEMRNEKDIIFFCTVTYELEKANKEKVEKTNTFCINPRLDDVV